MPSAPRIALEKLDPGWSKRVKEEDTIAFVNSPSRVRNFVHHKLLELFNVQLELTSPPLKLGVSRADGKEIRQEAHKLLDAFRAELEPCLPQRIRPGFPPLVARHLCEADEACNSVDRLRVRKDARYPAEKEKWLKALAEFCDLKYKLMIMIQNASSLVEHISTFEGILHLLTLDKYPLALSREFVDALSASQGMTPEALCGMMKDLFVHVGVNAVRCVLARPVDEVDRRRRGDLYRKMLRIVVPHPLATQVGPYLDAPHLYPNLQKEETDRR